MFFSKTRRALLLQDAASARSGRWNIAMAFTVIVIYNLIGILDVISTIAAIELGVAEEANPLLRAVMEHYGLAWIAAKLFLQITISGMVLWFPHRFVLMIFAFAVWTNGFVVLNNFRIALGI